MSKEIVLKYFPEPFEELLIDQFDIECKVDRIIIGYFNAVNDVIMNFFTKLIETADRALDVMENTNKLEMYITAEKVEEDIRDYITLADIHESLKAYLNDRYDPSRRRINCIEYGDDIRINIQIK